MSRNLSRDSATLVLIIEDSFICQKIYLTSLGTIYHIELVGTVAEALEHLLEKFYQCIISDLGLPDKPGIELFLLFVMAR